MRYLVLYISFLTNVLANAQDTLFFKDSKKIIGDVIEITPSDVKYKIKGDLSGEIFNCSKTKLIQICFSNGKKELFDAVPEPEMPAIISKTTNTNTDSIIKQPKENSLNKYDSIFFKNGKIAVVKIMEVNSDGVKYKNINNPDGPNYSISKNELKEIIYSTGLKESFNTVLVSKNESLKTVTNSIYDESLLIQGKADAKKYYKHKGGSIGTGILTAIVAPFGLIPAITCSMFEPKESNLDYPNKDLWNKPEYKTAYKFQAYKMKVRRMWITFSIGAVICYTWISLVSR